MNWYQKAWAQGLLYRKEKEYDTSPEIMTMLSFVGVETLLYFEFLSFIKIFFAIDFPFLLIEIKLFSSEKLNFFLSLLIFIMLPIFILNYFFLIKDKSFQLKLKEYRSSTYEYYLWFLYIGFGLVFAPIILGIIAKIWIEFY